MAKDTFPSSTLFHYPILVLLSDGNVHTVKEMIPKCIENLNISEHDQKVVTSSGKNKVHSWILFANQDLSKAGYIVHSKEGYIITPEGQVFLNKHKDGFVARDMIESESYRKYKNLDENGKQIKKEKKASPSSYPNPETGTGVNAVHDDGDETPAKSPIEILEELSAHINETLDTTLLDALKGMKADAFERLIRALLIKMEISKSNDCIELTQYIKDDGVDLYVYDNVLKMNVVCCIQVKKYTDTAVGLSTVKELGGTLLDKNCKSGMVITTSQFTKGATEYNPSGYNIQKIDGVKLTNLLIQYGLGVKTKRIEVKTIDVDYLNSI